ncbi:MAG: hypothetical protein ACXWMU_01950, partial [Candidatus Limnocylindrales bacterium]
MTRHARQHPRQFAPFARMVRATLRPGQTRLPHRRQARLAAMVGVAVTVVGLWAAAPRPLPVVPYDPSGPFTVDTDLRSQSGLRAADIDTYLA